MKDQPRGYSRVTLQQIIDCDKQMFVMASHLTMGKLTANPGEKKPLDEAIATLKSSSEIFAVFGTIANIEEQRPSSEEP